MTFLSISVPVLSLAPSVSTSASLIHVESTTVAFRRIQLRSIYNDSSRWFYLIKPPCHWSHISIKTFLLPVKHIIWEVQPNDKFIKCYHRRYSLVCVQCSELCTFFFIISLPVFASPLWEQSSCFIVRLCKHCNIHGDE